MVGEKKIEPPCLSRLSCRCVYLSLSPTPVCVSIFLSIPPCLFLFIPSLLSVLLSFSLSPKSCLCFYISISPLLSVYLSVSLSFSLSLLSLLHSCQCYYLSLSPTPACVSIFLSPTQYSSLSPTLSPSLPLSLSLSLFHSCLCYDLSLSPTPVCACIFLSLSLPPFLSL